MKNDGSVNSDGRKESLFDYILVHCTQAFSDPEAGLSLFYFT